MPDLKEIHAAILVEDLYEDLELWYPRLRLQEAGVRVTIVGPQAQTYKSKHGYPVEADTGIQQVNIDGFNGVVIPGGYAPDHMRRNARMVEFVRKAWDQDKIVAAICHAGWMLASAGIIKGKRLTGFSSIKDDLVNAGASYEDAPVVRDGNLITSRVPSDLPDFCRTLIEAFSEK